MSEKTRLDRLIDRLKGSAVARERDLAGLFPPERIEEIKKRELKRFKEAQDRKWRNWLESVSR